MSRKCLGSASERSRRPSAPTETTPTARPYWSRDSSLTCARVGLSGREVKGCSHPEFARGGGLHVDCAVGLLPLWVKLEEGCLALAPPHSACVSVEKRPTYHEGVKGVDALIYLPAASSTCTSLEVSRKCLGSV